MPAHEGGAARTGAGVRKPPMEETAGGVARWRVRRCGDFAAVSASTTFATWHELCEWVKTHNWIGQWHKESGDLQPAELARAIVGQLFLGFESGRKKRIR